jgi:phosphatidylglycerol lysyltransferase
MAFLVRADPYTRPEEHTYVVATAGDAVVGLLSAIPAYAGQGWLVEHLVCALGSPNGTAETLLDALHRSLIDAGQGEARVSLGLAPLVGPKTGWQKVARTLTRPLFDFEGLQRFKARLRPAEWRPVWLLVPPGSSRLLALLDVLTAFAGGSLVRFALRSVFVRPRALLWLLAIGLVPWTGLLVWLDVTHEQGVAGYSQPALAAWIAFDVVLAAALFRTALRPAYWALVALVLAALGDGALSLVHLRNVGVGPTLPDEALRIAAALAPFIGATTLLWITLQKARWLSRSAARGSARA